MGGGQGEVPVVREADVIAIVYDLDANLVGDDLERIQEETKINLFARQAANIRKHAQGNEAKAQMVATIQTRADRAAVKAAREATAACSNIETMAAIGNLADADRKG
jgi:hypothetical protein